MSHNTLTVRQKICNDIHGNYKRQAVQLFARLWSWRVVRDSWLGSHGDLHANMRILAFQTNDGEEAKTVSALRHMGAHSTLFYWALCRNAPLLHSSLTLARVPNDAGWLCVLCPCTSFAHAIVLVAEYSCTMKQ